MRLLFLLFASICVMALTTARAQETFRAFYDTLCSFEKDTSIFQEKTELDKGGFTYPCALEIHADRTYFYNYVEMLYDSTFTAVYNQTRDLEEALRVAEKVKSEGLQMTVKSAFTCLQRTTAYKIYNDYYMYEEEMTRPEWMIDESITEVKSGYECHRATAKYLGRQWSVWYTPEIPTSAGPWKLWGLPGLIVDARDESGRFSFEMTFFGKIAPELMKEDLTKYSPRSKSRTGSKDKVLRILEMYITNPLAFLTAMDPRITVTIGNPDDSFADNSEFSSKFEYIELKD